MTGNFKNLRIVSQEVTINGFVDRNVAIVGATLETDVAKDGGWRASGSSKRAPGDPEDADMGSMVALSRALRALADEVDLEVAERLRLGEERRAEAEVRRRVRRTARYGNEARALLNQVDPGLRARRIGARAGAVTKPERDTD